VATAPQPQPNDDGVVKVTLNTVYQMQLQQSVDLAEIRGTLLLLSNNMTNAIETSKDHEGRIRFLEKNVLTKNGMYALISAAGVLAVVISAVVGWASR
jgi:hypothetical protein